MSCRLDDLEIGQTAKIIGYRRGSADYRARLLSMGLTRGASLMLTGRAPLGDPVRLSVRGTEISLRGDEAAVLLLEPVARIAS